MTESNAWREQCEQVFGASALGFDFRERAARMLRGAVAAWLLLCLLCVLSGTSALRGEQLQGMVNAVLLGAACLAAGLTVASSVLNAPEPLTAGQLHVLGGDCTLVRSSRGRTQLAAHEVLGAAFVPPVGEARPRVEVRLEGYRTLSVTVDDDSMADDLIYALGCGAERRRAVLTSAERSSQKGLFAALGTFPVLLVATLVLDRQALLADNSRLCLLLALSGLVGVATSVALGARRFVVGVDGVLFEGFFGKRFYSFDGVVRAELRGERLDLVTAASKRASLPVKGARPELRAALEDRVNKALRARKRSKEAQLDASMLTRAGRPVAAWRAALADLVNTAAGFREVGVDKGSVVKLLHDARASMEQRLAAALALTAGGDEEAREQVRAVADTVSEESVRVALERVAAGSVDDAAIERALRAVEPRAGA